MSLRVAISGSGHRSRSVWQRHVYDTDGVALVGVQDPAPASLAAAVEAGAVDEGACFAELHDMLDATKPDALIVCNINEAHAATVEAGLEAGCHVLVEKPFATELADAVRLTELAHSRDRVLGVVQNWRTKSVGAALRRAIDDKLVGDVSHVFFRYVRDREAPRLPAYLFAEPDPLLYAMSIHHFDLFRYALDDEIVSVEGRSWRPAWSRYEHPSSMQLYMETARGIVISYVATFSSRGGHLPLESLQVEGELGTLLNDSQYSEPPLWLSRRGEPEMIDLTAEAPAAVSDQYVLADRAILDNFVAAVRDGSPLVASAVDNLGTVSVIEAARIATTEHRAVDPTELLARCRKGSHA